MKISDINFSKLRFYDNKSKSLIKYNGETTVLFVDIPNCIAIGGLTKNKFNKESMESIQIHLSWSS